MLGFKVEKKPQTLIAFIPKQQVVRHWERRCLVFCTSVSELNGTLSSWNGNAQNSQTSENAVLQSLNTNISTCFSSKKAFEWWMTFPIVSEYVTLFLALFPFIEMSLDKQSSYQCKKVIVMKVKARLHGRHRFQIVNHSLSFGIFEIWSWHPKGGSWTTTR